MKLREFNFNSIKRIAPTNLAVRLDEGKWYEGGSIGETLKILPLHFADATVKDTRWFFDTFVIELESETARWKGAGMGDYDCSYCGERVSGNSLKYCPKCKRRMTE